MAWIVLLTMLAAWGVFCAGWLLWGWLLQTDTIQEPVFLCGVPDFELSIRRCRWLCDSGLLKGRLIVNSDGLSDQMQAILLQKYPGLEFCSLEALPRRLELERNELDG